MINQNSSYSTYKREFKSPVFNFFNNNNINASSSEVFDFYSLNPATEKYTFFNYFRIINLSSNLILIYPNQDQNQIIPIPSNAVVQINDDVVKAWTSVKIENVGATTILQNEIRFQVWKDLVTTNTLLKNIHEKFLTEIKPNILSEINIGSKKGVII